MDCYYINLDAAVLRKVNLENSFHRNKKPDWDLHRFAAIDADYVRRENIAGSKSAAEKACFLSHQRIIGAHPDDSKTIFVLEDDAKFGAQTCTIVDNILKANRSLDWDILYTDICVPIAATMFDLLKLRQKLAQKNEMTLIDLSKISQFAGATAYLVNARSKRKVHELLTAAGDINQPYDLVLRKLIFEGKLKGYALFPFVTSLSEASETSQIQTTDADASALVFNLFRKLVWTERNLEECRASLELMKKHLGDEESEAFGALFAAMASAKYKII